MRLIPRRRRPAPSEPPAADGRCTATTRAGSRCKLPGRPLCAIHATPAPPLAAP